MVTKVKAMRQALEFSSNFEHNPNTTTGLNFGYFQGSYTDATGKLVQSAASTQAVPDNVVSLFYIDLQPTTPVVKAEIVASITSKKFVPLYSITAVGGAITAVTDLRSFTSASQSVDQ